MSDGTDGSDSAPPLQSRPTPPKKVFDVLRPGRAPAHATSKPVIVGHGSHQPDPMFASKQAAQPSFAAGDEYLARRASAPDDSDDKAQVAAKESDQAAAQPAGATLSQSAPQASEAPAASSSAANTDESVATDGQIAAPSADASQNTGTSLSQDSHPANSSVFTLGDAATNAVIADTAAPDLPLQNAVVSHHRPQSRASWWMVFWVIVLLLALTAAALDILLDTGFIKTSLHVPHTHFFGIV